MIKHTTIITGLIVLSSIATSVSARELPQPILNKSNINVAERINSNLNRPPLNVNSALHSTEEIKARQLALLDRFIAQNTFRQTQVEERTEMDETLKTTILTDLQTEATELATLRTTIESANTFIELRAAMQDMKTHAEERQAFLKSKQSELTERGRKNAEAIEAKEQEILEHLNTAVSHLQSLGVDTSSIETLISEHTAHTARLKSKKADMTLEELKSEGKELQSEIKAIIIAIKTAAKSIAPAETK